MKDFKQLLEHLVDGNDLTAEQAGSALQQIISGEISNERIAAFLYGMRAKGETVEELTAFVKVMRNAAIKVNADIDGAVDLCGTGGDNANTFNISTAAMFIVAGADVPVLKHGNRSVSSKSGSADVLEALGAVATLRKEAVEKVFEETKMAFMFAPYYHPAMKHVMPARKSLGIRTFFNVLGPLLNPAQVRRQIVGAFNVEVARQIIQILSNLDTEFAYAVNAHDGLDEFSLSAQSEVFELNENLVSEPIRFDPRELDFEWVDEELLKGGDADYNADIIRNITDNRAEPAQQNIALLNATFAIHAAGKADNLQEARQMATESVESGKARKALDHFVEATQDYSS